MVRSLADACCWLGRFRLKPVTTRGFVMHPLRERPFTNTMPVFRR